jgi:DNA polymerase phi
MEDLEDQDEDEDDADAEAEGKSSGSSSEDDDEADDSNDEAPDLELRQKIEEALRINGIEAATGDTDDSDEEEELMDDDQMMAIDDHLADVFRSRAGEKKGGKGKPLT